MLQDIENQMAQFFANGGKVNVIEPQCIKTRKKSVPTFTSTEKREVLNAIDAGHTTVTSISDHLKMNRQVANSILTVLERQSKVRWSLQRGLKTWEINGD